MGDQLATGRARRTSASCPRSGGYDSQAMLDEANGCLLAWMAWRLVDLLKGCCMLEGMSVIFLETWRLWMLGGMEVVCLADCMLGSLGDCAWRFACACL